MKLAKAHDILKHIIRENELNCAILVTLDHDDNARMVAVTTPIISEETPILVEKIHHALWPFKGRFFDCANKFPI